MLRFENILADSLTTDISIKWDSMLRHDSYKSFECKKFDMIKPDKDQIKIVNERLIPKDNIITKLFQKPRQKRQELIAEINAKIDIEYETQMTLFNSRQSEYDAYYEVEYQKYLEQKKDFEMQQEKHNDSIAKYKLNLYYQTRIKYLM